jgi:peroxiredoxin
MSDEATPETATQPARGSAWSRLKAAMNAKPHLRWLFDGAFFVLVFGAIGLWQTRAHVHGGPVPAFELRTTSGAVVSSAALAGKPTLLAFWAPWCTVCETESRNLGWAQRLAGDRARVLSVATAWQQPQQVTAYTERNGVDYPVLLDDGALADQLNISSYPTVYFLDERGHIKGSVVGYTTTLGLLLRTLF